MVVLLDYTLVLLHLLLEDHLLSCVGWSLELVLCLLPLLLVQEQEGLCQVNVLIDVDVLLLLLLQCCSHIIGSLHLPVLLLSCCSSESQISNVGCGVGIVDQVLNILGYQKLLVNWRSFIHVVAH